MWACRIGHGPEMEEFEDEVVSASNEVLVNVQMLYRSLLGRNPSSKQRASQASLRLIVGGRKELDADQTQLSSWADGTLLSSQSTFCIELTY